MPSTFAPISMMTPANRAHPLNRGRVAWWLPVPGRFGGSTLADLMGRYPADLISSPTWRADRPFAGLDLNGSTQYLLATASSLPNLGQVTVGIRFTPSPSFIAAGGELIVRAASGGDVSRGCRIYWNSTIGLHTDSYGGYAYRASGFGLSAGVEYSLVLALNASTGGYGQYYSDGQPVSTSALVTVPGNNTAGMPFAIGSQFGIESSAIRLAEAWVYDRILTAAEVAQLFSQSRLGYPDLIVRDWLNIALPCAAIPPSRFRRLGMDGGFPAYAGGFT